MPIALDIFAVSELLSANGWYLDRQNRPDSLHATVHAGSAATVPELVRRRGDPWMHLADEPQSLVPLLAMAERDRANGLHDAPWPPEYPKQPDEPSRVAPSRARKA